MFIVKSLIVCLVIFGTSQSYAVAKNPLCARALHALQDYTIDKHVRQVRRDLNLESGRGFAVLNTSEYFPREIYEKLLEELPQGKTIFFDHQSGKPIKIFDRATGHSYDNGNLNRFFPIGFFKVIKIYRDKIQGLINEAMQPLNFEVTSIQLRTQNAGFEDFEKQIVGWHLDNGYINTITNILGTGTYYYWQQTYRQIPPAHTVIASGEARGKPYLHRAPSENQDRITLIMTLEPIGQLQIERF